MVELARSHSGRLKESHYKSSDRKDHRRGKQLEGAAAVIFLLCHHKNGPKFAAACILSVIETFSSSAAVVDSDFSKLSCEKNKLGAALSTFPLRE